MISCRRLVGELRDCYGDIEVNFTLERPILWQEKGYHMNNINNMTLSRESVRVVIT